MKDASKTKVQLLEELERLKQDCHRLESIGIEAERSRQCQKVINNLLLISMKNKPLKHILELAIDQITSIEWLVLESKGAIFLTDNQSGNLELVAWRAFSKPAIETCAQVPLGRCLCGKAAKSGRTVFADCIDERHDNLYPHITPHGHYCVPIISSDGTVIGVITLYVKEGHCRNESEESFLAMIAGTLAGIIEFKHIEEALAEKQRELEIKNRGIEDVNTALTVLLKKRQEDKENLEKSIAYNIKMLVEPHLERLKAAKLTTQHRAHLELLEQSLLEITSPFAFTLSYTFRKLTPVELQVATMIKQGKSTKDIARLVHISEQTVSVHRRNIRKKLGLSNLKANLRTHLLSIQ